MHERLYRCASDIQFDDSPVQVAKVVQVKLKPFSETCNFLQYQKPLTPEHPCFFARIISFGKLTVHYDTTDLCYLLVIIHTLWDNASELRQGWCSLLSCCHITLEHLLWFQILLLPKQDILSINITVLIWLADMNLSILKQLQNKSACFCLGSPFCKQGVLIQYLLLKHAQHATRILITFVITSLHITGNWQQV